MLQSTIENRLDCAEAVYFKAVLSLQDEIRTNLIIPFCDKEKVYFRSGMGTFAFYFPKGDKRIINGWGTIDDEKLPKPLKNALNVLLLGGRWTIGESIADYYPEGIK